MVWKKKQVIPVYPRTQHLPFLLEQRSETHRNQHYEQFSELGKRAWQSSVRITLNQDVARIGDGIEPLDALRENVEMRNDEDEQPLDAEVPRARLNQKNRTNREKQEHEDSGIACKKDDKISIWDTMVVS